MNYVCYFGLTNRVPVRGMRTWRGGRTLGLQMGDPGPVHGVRGRNFFTVTSIKFFISEQILEGSWGAQTMEHPSITGKVHAFEYQFCCCIFCFPLNGHSN